MMLISWVEAALVPAPSGASLIRAVSGASLIRAVSGQAGPEAAPDAAKHAGLADS